MTKTQRWDWAVSLKLEELNDQHLQAAYKLNWDSLCKFDSCRKNCKRILCLACFDKSWIDDESANNSGYDNFDTTNFEQERTDLKSFVGLKNLGATCYVNCLLQLWFHNPALRKAIYKWDKNSNVEVQQDDVSCGRKTIQAYEHNNDDAQSSKLTSKQRLKDDEKSRSCSPMKLSKTLNEKNDRQVSTTSQDSPPPSSKANKQSKSQQPEDSGQTGAIEQLQLIFARLQFTNKKSIDPFNFIASLNLNASEQQDAQEFGHLFMDFLERSFTNQKNSFVSNIIQNQFCGRYSYATICDHCKHSSLSDSTFYELDLSIQNLETLHDCLNEYFRPVPLDGKYNCSHCQKAQSAHRKIILKSLPPTLNLQLLRFVYDVQRNIRQKLNSYIIFPEKLDMNPYLSNVTSKSRQNNLDISARNSYGYSDNRYLSTNGLSSGSRTNNKSNIYILSAVLIHRGSSPHSGHYIAHIKDRVTQDWYKFNDDSVEKIGPQLQVSTEGETITIVDDKSETIKNNESGNGKAAKLESKSLKSKTAYMLVYQAQGNETLSYPSDHSEEWELPDHLQTAVAEENSRSIEIFESLQIAKEVDQQIMDARKNQIRTIYEKLVCRDPTDKFEFISKSWLQNWLTNSSSSAKFPPIDNSQLLCIHDRLDFRKMDQVKCVRTEGVDLLYKEFGGGSRLQDAMCRDCVELEVKLIQLKDKMKDDQKYITSQAKFKIEAGYDFEDAYIVGKNSYRDWQALVMVQFEKSYPELRSRERDNGSHNQNSSDEDENKEKSSRDNKDSSKNQSDNSDTDDEAKEKFVFNSDILCDHNQLVNDCSAWRIVPKEVWWIFKHYFGNDPTRPLIEYNANTLMCVECKKQEMAQQEIGDIQKQRASEQKSVLIDLFHNRKRASWCSMLPGDEYYALDRQFLTKWQKFIRNPCNQEQPNAVINRDRLVCEHGKSLYNHSNSNPILPECPFVLITSDELEQVKRFYTVDYEIRFSIDPPAAEEKLKFYQSLIKTSATKKTINSTDGSSSTKPIDISGDNDDGQTVSLSQSTALKQESPVSQTNKKQETLSSNSAEPLSDPSDELDLTEVDWSDCVICEPDYCSKCHEMLKQDELKKLLNYESATIYITKVENPCTFGPQPNPNPNATTNGSQSTIGDNCDTDANQEPTGNKQLALDAPDGCSGGDFDVVLVDEQPFKRRKKMYIEDEGNDFVPPGVGKQPTQSNQSSNSILRRTTRRNRNREQAYTIKPTQTLLQLKKEIFARCQVLPLDQRLFLNDILLDDNDKTMSELRIIPNCSLKLEVSISGRNENTRATILVCSIIPICSFLISIYILRWTNQ